MSSRAGRTVSGGRRPMRAQRQREVSRERLRGIADTHTAELRHQLCARGEVGELEQNSMADLPKLACGRDRAPLLLGPSLGPSTPSSAWSTTSPLSVEILAGQWSGADGGGRTSLYGIGRKRENIRGKTNRHFHLQVAAVGS
jgi:hypothetical protein